MNDAHLDVAALYAALDQERKERAWSWRQVAADAGVSASTLTRMRQGKRPDVDSFAKLVGWLGLSSDKFLRKAEAPSRGRRPGVMAEISAFLRADKELSPRTAHALEEIIRAAYERLKGAP